MMGGMSNHHAQAIAHISAVKAAAQALREEYARPHHDRAAVADLNAEVSRGLKIAEVEAVLAVADAIKAANGQTRGVTL